MKKCYPEINTYTSWTEVWYEPNFQKYFGAWIQTQNRVALRIGIQVNNHILEEIWSKFHPKSRSL